MDKFALEMNGRRRPITAMVAFLAQAVEAGIVVLYWLAWSFDFGKLPYSIFWSSVIFGLPLTLTVAAARGLHLGREWGWWLSVVINATLGLCVLAIGSFDLRAVLIVLLLALPTLLLLPTTRRYYFTFRP